MGNVCLTADERTRRQVRLAVTTLLESRRNVEQRVQSIEQSRNVIVAKLRGVPKTDTIRRRYLLVSIRDHERQRADHYALLANVDASVRRLEDVQVLTPTIEALRGGVRMTQSIDADRVQRTIDHAIEEQERLADVWSAMATACEDDGRLIESMSDADLDTEIDRLLNGNDREADLNSLKPPPTYELTHKPIVLPTSEMYPPIVLP